MNPTPSTAKPPFRPNNVPSAANRPKHSNTMKYSMLVVAAAALVAGCRTTDRGYVQREWSTTLRELGVSPVFPPREDIVVGDIYAYDFDPGSVATLRLLESKWENLSDTEKSQRQQIGMSPRLARLNLNRRISDSYSETLSAPATGGDYHSILGNQALAAATDAVEEAEAKKTALEDQLDASKVQANTAQSNLIRATRRKEDSDTDVARADDAVKKANTETFDVSQKEQELANAKKVVREKEDLLTAARNRLADAVKDSPEEKQLKIEFTRAEREKAAADLDVKRSEEDLASLRTQKPHLATALQNLAVAKANQAQAVDALTAATRAKADADAALLAAKTELDPKIAEAGAQVKKAEEIRDAIAKAGEKTLYAQPRDPKKNIFTGDEFLQSDPPEDIMNSRVNRLRLVGFPDFASVNFTQGDLSALIPVEAFAVGLNVSGSKTSRVSVKVPSAESYGISIDDVRNDVVDSVGCLTSDLLNALRFQHSYRNKNISQIAYLRVITETFYARALDITVYHSKSFGARGQVAPIGNIGGIPAQDFSKNLSTKAAPLNVSGVSTDTAKAALAALEANLGRTQTVPGGSVQVVSFNEQSVGLRRIFDRPVAIGTRGLILKVDLKDGAVTTRVDGSVAPTSPASRPSMR